MDAVKFIEEARRRYKVTGRAPSVLLNNWLEPESIVKDVEEWSVAHPINTRQTEFLKQWADTVLDSNGVVVIEPCTLAKEYQDIGCKDENCAVCRKNFWAQVSE